MTLNRAIRVLFVPGNAGHIKAFLPIAEELHRRGHELTFLLRDAVVDPEYHTAETVKRAGFSCHEYSGYYVSDVNRRLPKLRTYLGSKRAVFAFLRSIDYDISVSCNDTSALFDRLVVEFSRQNQKQALLVQESVRPAQRQIAMATTPGRRKLSVVVDKMIEIVGRCPVNGAFARRPYGHSCCTMIAAAGDRFRWQLKEQGVSGDKIRVTGQPRLDGAMQTVKWPSNDASTKAERVLLFCNQPIRESHLLDRLFVDLVTACDACDNVRLLVKLHPRDLPVDYWLRLLPVDAGSSILEITNNRKLEECFQLSDAMITVASTTSLEAMAAGLPVALVNYLPISWYLPYDEAGAAMSITSALDLRESISSLLFGNSVRESLRSHAESVLRDELYLRDGGSARRIVDFIEERLQRGGR
jgi:hypothetical protein